MPRVDPPSREALRKRTAWNVLTSPWALVPAAIGGSLLAAAVAVPASIGAGALLAFGGVATLATGAGLTVTRWLANADGYVEKSYEQLTKEAHAEQEKWLDRLDKALRADRDGRTEGLLRRLRAVYTTLRETRGVPHEVRAKADELFDGCVQSLVKTLEMVNTARQLRSVGAHRRLLADREEVIGEVAHSVAALERALDDVRTSRGDAAGLSKVRAELDATLDIARRVEERVAKMSDEIDRERE
ncbi:MAG: hypothetical protein AAGD32_09090 [Planctomycetota bacterium]